ncbi:hypothetical protein U1Q18_024527 [Sarracenia purpurea var. burkii]
MLPNYSVLSSNPEWLYVLNIIDCTAVLGIPRVMPSCSGGGVEEEELHHRSSPLRYVRRNPEPEPFPVIAADAFLDLT